MSISSKPSSAVLTSVLASSLMIAGSASLADEEIVITLEPMNATETSGIYRMRIVDPPENLSTLVFMQYVTRYESMNGALHPVSEIAISFNCTQGMSICGPFLEGPSIFSPTEIFLDKDLRYLPKPGKGLCDLKYLFTYPAYYYLATFDWEADDPNVTYFDDRRLAPNFVGIEQWVVVDSNCEGVSK